MFTRPKNHEPIPWKHGVVSTPLFTAGFVYAGGLGISMATDYGHTLPLPLLAIGSTTGIITAAVSRWIRTRDQHPFPHWFHTAFTTTWTATAYAWIAHASHGVPWTLESAAYLAIATTALSPLYALDRWFREDKIAAQWQAEAAATQADLNEWEELWVAVGARGVRVEASTPTRGGYELPLTLTGTPFDSLRALLPRLEVLKGDLRPGALQLKPGELASHATLMVSTRNVLAETIDLPDEAHPLTINEPLTIGMLESGEPIEILFRQNSILIAGKKGSGKSIAVHVIISLITRCTDAVIWMVDMAEGNTAKRWLRPWVEEWQDTEGRLIDRPILDWVATTPAEATRMYEAALAVADGRARRMRGGKIVPAEDQPAIILISDECSDLMAWHPEAVKPKTRLLKKGRKAAIDVLDAVQRGTGPNTGGGEVSSQYDTTIGMKFARKAEGQFVFPDYYGSVNLAKLPGRGALYLLDEDRAREGGIGPERGKGYFANDEDEHPDGTPRDDIEQLAAARWDLRPDLDTASQSDAEPYGYSTRWTDAARIEWLLDACGQPTHHTATAQQAAPAHRTAASTSSGTITPLPPMHHYLDKYKDWKPDHTTGPARHGGSGGDDPAVEKAIADGLAEFERIAQQAAVNLTKAPEPDRKHPRRDEIIAMVRAAGPDGISIDEARQRLGQAHPDEKPPSRQAVTNWFAGHDNIDKPAGTRGVYVWITAGDPPARTAHTSDTELAREISELLPLAIRLVVDKQFASTAMLQRNLRINHERSTQVLAALEAAAIIGPDRGQPSREVLVDAEEFNQIVNPPTQDDDQ